MHFGNLSQITLPNMWLLVLIDLANKLNHIEKFLISFDAICFYKLRYLEILQTNLFNKIQFNSMYMWLSSLNIFEENQFYEMKKRII